MNMDPKLRLLVCFTIAAMTTWTRMALSEIFTSSLKVHRMVLEEDRVLEELKKFIDYQYERLKLFNNFYTDRLRDVRSHQNHDLDLRHPNAVYRTIKRYAAEYSGVLGDNFESFRANVQSSLEHFLADLEDIQGAQLSLLRLQNVYNMKALDMAMGDYLGFHGPQLTPKDAYEIGQTAFYVGKLNESLEWLNATLTMYSHKEVLNLGVLESGPTVGAIKALMGRVHIFNGNPHLAEALLEEAKRLDPRAGDVLQLTKEMWTQPLFEPSEPVDYFQNFSQLCSLENRHHPAEPNSPHTVCRYRETVLPYYRFKEEILSVAPFASVIYNVISDAEGEHMMDFVRNKLIRGRVVTDKEGVVSDIRTSDLAWIYDKDSPVADTIAKRITSITGLETEQNMPNGPSSGEAFQVVNYGLGGHYEVHMDPFDKPVENVELRNSGERIATFLIYLSDVERGGSTVFTRANVSVAPIKNMALFWYNFDPAHQLDLQTYHAGCPVLIGQKWIVNKWIWTHGNTFRRRCGLRPDVTQLDIESDMRRGYA